MKLWVRESITEGRLKNCWNLQIDKIDKMREEDGEMVTTGESYFAPICTHQSFESKFAHIDDDMQLAMLERNLQNAPVSCPRNCTYYQNYRWGRAKFVTKRAATGSYNTVRSLLKGFSSLSWQTQVALIVLMVLIISPQWVPVLISLVKAIWGKNP